MSGPRDEFLSEEDLDLRNLSEDELVAYWNLWLEQAQVTNDLDAALYSHGWSSGYNGDARSSADVGVPLR